MASAQPMKQSHLDLNLGVKRTRKQELHAQMELVAPWAALVELIAPYYPNARTAAHPLPFRPCCASAACSQWFRLSDLGMEEAFCDTPLYREFAQLDAHGRLPDESTILRFRHRLERYKLAEQMLATVNVELTRFHGHCELAH